MNRNSLQFVNSRRHVPVSMASLGAKKHFFRIKATFMIRHTRDFERQFNDQKIF